ARCPRRHVGLTPAEPHPPAPTADLPAPPCDSAAPDSAAPDYVPITRDGLPDEAAMEAAGLDAQLQEYRRRLRAVRQLDRYQAQADHGELTGWAELVADEYDVSTRTLYRWRQDLEEGGLAALVPDTGGRRGSTVLPPELRRKIRAFYLDRRQPTVAQVWRQVVLPYYQADGLRCPHYSTVRRFLERSVRPLEEIALRLGERAYKTQIEPKVKRDLATADVNGIWCADHRLWDVMVAYPDGRGTGWGRHKNGLCPCGSGRSRAECCSLVRPWVTMIIDVRSAGIVGYRLGRTPTAAGVCHAIRSAMSLVGVPQKFYRDNGKEFTANRLGGKADRPTRPRQRDLDGAERWPTALPDDVEDMSLWQAYDIQVISALPYSSWSKPIEPIFGAFSRVSGENLMPGWTGRSTASRPEVLERCIEQGLILAWQDFGELFAKQVFAWNTSHTCGDREGPPAHYYKDYAPRRPDPRTLAYLIQDRRRLRVRQQGIMLDGQPYLTPALARYVGCTVDVRWDPEEPGVAYVYPPDGECLAVTPAKMATWDGWGEANIDVRRAAKAQRAELARTREDLAGALTVDESDPTGAFRRVWRRMQQDAWQHQADPDRHTSIEAADGAARPKALTQPRALEEAQDQPDDDQHDDPVRIYRESIERLKRRMA
ncbi:MAG: Mu transposase C-terminal domain-containing protein, partial [Planctomycetota bacterium]